MSGYADVGVDCTGPLTALGRSCLTLVLYA